jgi:indole-3-glycerol phosphate synthase
MILDAILASTRDRVAVRQRRRSTSVLERAALDAPAPRGFARAVAAAPAQFALIAELKPASPSAGILRQPFDAVELATAYAAGGATALSVLTETEFFAGSYTMLERVAELGLACLQKDFVVSEYQILEGRAAGADAVLLIAEALPGDRDRELVQFALDLGMDVLYEAHAPKLVRRVAGIAERDPERVMVGVNNRDLQTFAVRLETSLEACRELPPGLLVVAESGIRTAADVRRLRLAGLRAILVGESLLRATDVEAATRELLAGREGEPE